MCVRNRTRSTVCWRTTRLTSSCEHGQSLIDPPQRKIAPHLEQHLEDSGTHREPGEGHSERLKDLARAHSARLRDSSQRYFELLLFPGHCARQCVPARPKEFPGLCG